MLLNDFERFKHEIKSFAIVEFRMRLNEGQGKRCCKTEREKEKNIVWMNSLHDEYNEMLKLKKEKKNQSSS